MTIAEQTPAISLITTCKGRLAYLQQSLPRMAAQPDAEVVLVDFDCPEGSGSWAEQAHPAVRVLRVADAPFFNAARARNFGAQLARAPWLFFVDADVLLADRCVERMLPALREGIFYITSGAEVELVGTAICLRRDYLAVGGYDEVIEGWSCEDLDLYARLRLLGRGQELFAPELLRVISHDDDTRVRHHETGDKWLAYRANALYVQVKHDLARQFGTVDLAPDTRRQLYAEARRATHSAFVSGKPERMEITLSGELVARFYHGWQMRRVWHYVVEPPAPPDGRASFAQAASPVGS